MSRLAGDVLIVEEEPPGTCAFCGQIAELRPYGPNDEEICADCGEKDPATTRRKMWERMSHVRAVVVDERMLKQRKK